MAGGAEDTDGVSVPAGEIALNGGTLRDVATGLLVLRGHEALAADPSRRVDGVRPAIESVRVSAAANSALGAGDVLRYEVAFSEPVFARGVTEFALGFFHEVDPPSISGWRSARFAGRLDGTTLAFDYTIGSADRGRWAGLFTNSALRNGRIVDAVGQAHRPAESEVTRALTIDGSRQGTDTVGPVVRSIAFAGAAPHDVTGNGEGDTYKQGDAVEVAVTFSEAVTVDTTGGTPTLALDVGGTTRAAAYASGTGTATLTFGYTVVQGDADDDGVAVPAGSIALAGGTLADAAGNAAARGHEALAPDPARRVDGSSAVVTGIAFAGVAPRAAADSTADTYWAGDAIEVAVTFSEAVTVDTAGGTPTLALDVGGVTRAAAYASGTGTATLTFAYTVARGEEDADGVAVPAGSIALAGGTLADAAGIPPALAHDALDADPARKVDGSLVPPTITGIEFAGEAPLDTDRDGVGDTYAVGDIIEVAVTFSRAVKVDIADARPRLALEVGTAEWPAAYASGSGTATLAFALRVREDVGSDTDGVRVPAGRIALNGGAIGDAAGPALLAHTGLAADDTRRVDAVAPRLGRH